MLSNVDTQEEYLGPKIRLLSSALNACLFLSQGTGLMAKFKPVALNACYLFIWFHYKALSVCVCLKILVSEHLSINFFI